MILPDYLRLVVGLSKTFVGLSKTFFRARGQRGGGAGGPVPGCARAVFVVKIEFVALPNTPPPPNTTQRPHHSTTTPSTFSLLLAHLWRLGLRAAALLRNSDVVEPKERATRSNSPWAIEAHDTRGR